MSWRERARLRLPSSNRYLSAVAWLRSALHRLSPEREVRFRSALVVLLCLVIAGTSAIAVGQHRSATRARLDAAASTLIAEAESAGSADPGRSMRMAIAANRLAPGHRTQATLLAALARNHYVNTLPNSSSVLAVAFARQPNILATGGRDGWATLWDVASPFSPHRLARFRGDSYGVDALALSPDGRVVVTGGIDKIATVWDVADKYRPVRIASWKGMSLRHLTFGTDGSTLIGATWDLDVIVWDLFDPAHPRQVARLATGGSCAALSPDGKTLATDDGNRGFVLWDISVPGHPRRLGAASGHSDTLEALAFSPDGRQLASASDDHTAILWNVTDPRSPVKQVVLVGHQNWIRSVAFSSDGKLLATGSTDRSVNVWRTDNPASPWKNQLTGQDSEVTSVAFSSDGHTLVSGSDDGTAVLWDVRERALPAFTQAGPIPYSSSDLVVTAGGRAAVISDFRGPTVIWDLTRTGKDAQPVQLGSLPGSTSTAVLAISPDGRTLLAGHDGSSAALWDITDPAHPVRVGLLPTFQHPLAFDAPAHLVALAGDRLASLWDVGNPAHPVRLGTLRGHEGEIVAGAASPDGRTLATASLDATAILWNVTNPRHPVLQATIHEPGSVYSVAFSGDGRTLATGSGTGAVVLYDIADRSHPVRLAALRIHELDVDIMVFSPDQHTLLTGGEEGRVALWDITDRNHPRQLELLGKYQLLDGAAFSPDGGRLVIGDFKRVEVWDMSARLRSLSGTADQACAQVGAGLSRSDWARYVPGVPYRPTCPAHPA